MKTILAPIDFSPATNAVVAAAAALARALDGRLVLLNVSRPPMTVADYGGFAVEMSDLMEQVAKSARTQLEKLRDQLENDFIKADAIHLTGLPVTLILEQARKLSADFLVLGSHGHTAFYDLMVGSTTAGVIKRAPCPVVVVPPPAKPKKPAKAKTSKRAIFPAPLRL